MAFSATLVTPDRVVLEAEVQGVMLRTEIGEAAFLPGHADLIGAVVPGLVRFVRVDGPEERAAVHGGFVQVDGEHVVVLAPVAELATEIDVERARQALAEAEDDEAAKKRAEVRLEVAGA